MSLCLCGNPRASGRSVCLRCKSRADREKAESISLCVVCRLLPPTNGRKCLPCSYSHTKVVRARKDRLRASGLCVCCGALPPKPGEQRCLPCSHRIKERRKNPTQ